MAQRPPANLFFFFFTRVTGPIRPLGLKLSDTRVYEPPHSEGYMEPALDPFPRFVLGFNVPSPDIRAIWFLNRLIFFFFFITLKTRAE